MDKEEAREILVKELNIFQAKSYAELAALIGLEQVMERTGQSGTGYQLEVLVLWDDLRKPEGGIRVLASIDDGKFRSIFKPLTLDFIKGPDGNFIGE